MAGPGNMDNNPFHESEITSTPCSSDIQICLCLLSGLPGSGKTTLLQTLLSLNNEYYETAQQATKFMFIGIEYDAIVPVHSSASAEDRFEFSGKWKFNRSQVLSAIEVLVEHIHHNGLGEISLKTKPQKLVVTVWQQFLHVLNLFNTERHKRRDKIVLIVDDNMYFRSMRYEYYKLARKYRTGYCQIYLECSLEKAMGRNANRDTVCQVPNEVILTMSKKIEPPDTHKHRWESNSITINTDNINISQILTVVQKAVLNPVQCLEDADFEQMSKCRIECSSSLIHQADLILRKCVTTKMAEFKASIQPELLREKSQLVLTIKEQIMQKLKEGCLPLLFSQALDVINASQDPDNELFKYLENLFLTELLRS